MRNAYLYVLALVLAAVFGGGAVAEGLQPSEGGEPPELSAFVERALAENPELRASEARWQAFVGRARAAGKLDDPMLMLRLQNAMVKDPLAFDQDPMTSKAIGISQMVPFYGKRALAREAAEFEAEAARFSHEERRIELRKMVKETWYRLYFVDRSREVVERNIALLDSLTRFTETMYGTGGGLQQDVLKAQLERSRMEDMRIGLVQQRRSLEALFNTLLFRPAGTPLPGIAEARIGPLELSAEELTAAAEEHRPLLKSLQALAEKAKTGKRIAGREYYPDFTLSLEYMQREPAMGGEGDDMYTAGVTFNLPIQRERRHAMVAEAEAEIRMAAAELDMLRNEIRREVADGLARLESSRRLAEIYRTGILPQAEQSYGASLSAYRVGKVDFMNVLESQMALFNVEREYFDAVAEHQMRLAQLEAVVGRPLSASAP